MNKILLEDLKYITNQDLYWEEFRNKTVLISGASGFIASYMVEVFNYLNTIKNLNIKIIVQCRNKEKALQRFKDIHESSQFIISTKDILDEISYHKDIDYIIHAASPATPKVFEKDPVGTILPNIVGTNNLLKLAVEKKVKGFLFVSTSGVNGYFEDNNYYKYPLQEDDIGILDFTKVSSCYLESKRAGENLCLAYRYQYNVPIKIVRPSITYGYGIKLRDGRAASDFIADILDKKDITLYSDGEVYRNFCYIADVILGFFIVLLKGQSGGIYNVATDKEIKIIELAELLTNKIFPDLNLKVLIKKDQLKDYPRTQFSDTQRDISKIKSLGWIINFDIEEGFKRTIEAYKGEV